MRKSTEIRPEKQQPGNSREAMSAAERGERFKESLARVKKDHASAIKRLADR